MHFFQLEAIPHPDSDKASEVGGAYVNCWVNFALEDGALMLAYYYIERAGWVAGKVIDSKWVEREDCRDKPDVLPYFAEAEEDGVCFVFHTWPLGAEDEDEDPEEEAPDEDPPSSPPLRA